MMVRVAPEKGHEFWHGISHAQIKHLRVKAFLAVQITCIQDDMIKIQRAAGGSALGIRNVGLDAGDQPDKISLRIAEAERPADPRRLTAFRSQHNGNISFRENLRRSVEIRVIDDLEGGMKQ